MFVCRVFFSMFLSGFEVVEKVLREFVSSECVSGVSVELQLDRLYVLKPPKHQVYAEVRNDVTVTPDYVEVQPEVIDLGSGRVVEVYTLSNVETYIAVLKPRVEMPENCFGVLLPRSSLLRCGVIAQGTLIDPGYKGNLRVLLKPTMPIRVERGARLFHIVVYCRDKPFPKTYSGQWQGEK